MRCNCKRANRPLIIHPRSFAGCTLEHAWLNAAVLLRTPQMPAQIMSCSEQLRNNHSHLFPCSTERCQARVRAAEQMLAAQLNDFHGRISRCAQRCQDTAQESLRSDANPQEGERAQVRASCSSKKRPSCRWTQWDVIGAHIPRTCHLQHLHPILFAQMYVKTLMQPTQW